MPDIGEELESLRRENARLRRLLKLTDAEASPALGTQTAWFDKAPGPVDARSSSQAKVEFYAALFAARRDVYAIRWENARSGKSGWMPAVEGGWRKGSNAAEQRYLPLTPEVLAAHLTGDIRIGLYPMLSGDQTCWLAADFDGSAAMLDALAYLKAARAVGAPAALEVSRSGVGAHVWIFFTDPVPAATARQLGTALVGEAITIRGRMDLRCYDRLFPSQDVLPGHGPGNLIAAPLQGKSRKIGTTVFLDLATLEPFEDQWEYLSTLERLTPRQRGEARLRVAGTGRRGRREAGPDRQVDPDATEPGVDRASQARRRGEDPGLGVESVAVRDAQARGVDLQPRVLRPATPTPVDLEHPEGHQLLRRDHRRPSRSPSRAARDDDEAHRGRGQQDRDRRSSGRREPLKSSPPTSTSTLFSRPRSMTCFRTTSGCWWPRRALARP